MRRKMKVKRYKNISQTLTRNSNKQQQNGKKEINKNQSREERK
jgi:hypothetical protein